MEEALRNDDLVATVIADGIHIDPRIVRDIIARKEIERVAAVSDAGFAMGFPEGEFSAFGVRGETSPDGRYLRVLPREGAQSPNPLSSDAAMLFGSAMGMREIFENLLNWLSVEMEWIHTRRHAALPFEEALRAACALTSGNPARLLGEAERGHLRPGARADAVLARIRGGPGEYRVEVRGVWVSGRGIESRSTDGRRI
jgi:N-acetylglucosamine-6-phosphate deacetylase